MYPKSPITQKDISGCAVTCVAYILDITYNKAINLFDKGREKAPFDGFFCKEIIAALKKANKDYVLKYVKPEVKNAVCPNNSIVFIKKSNKYPIGHYLCRSGSYWMDPWINFPKLQAKSGFRKNLPGKANYLMRPVPDNT